MSLLRLVQAFLLREKSTRALLHLLIFRSNVAMIKPASTMAVVLVQSPCYLTCISFRRWKLVKTILCCIKKRCSRLHCHAIAVSTTNTRTFSDRPCGTLTWKRPAVVAFRALDQSVRDNARRKQQQAKPVTASGLPPLPPPRHGPMLASC